MTKNDNYMNEGANESREATKPAKAAKERRLPRTKAAANEATNERRPRTKAATNERTKAADQATNEDQERTKESLRTNQATKATNELQKPGNEGLRKKRGGKTASIADNTTARPEEIARAVRNAFQYFNRNIVKSDDECAERINGYFRDCADQQMLPTVENLSLALGTVRRTVWDWEQGIGCSVARTNMIKKAKQILASIDAELVSSGKIPQVVYIFRAKNFYQMSDQQEIMINAGGSGEQDMSAEEIAKRYLEDGKTVEAELVEDSNMDG